MGIGTKKILIMKGLIMKRSLLFVVAGLLAIGIMSPYLSYGASKDDVLARIGNAKKITVSDIDILISKLPQRHQIQFLTREAKLALAKHLADIYIMSEEARKMGLDKLPKNKKFIEDTINKILSDMYVEELAAKNIKVTGADIKEYYDKHKTQYIRPEQVRVKHILLKDKKMAETVLKELKKGKNFSELAKSKSEDKLSAQKGGEIGWISHNMVVKEFEDAAFRLKKGEISPIVKTRFGYHIIMLEDRRPEHQIPLEDVRAHIKQKIFAKKKETLVEETIKNLRKKYKVTYNGKIEPGKIKLEPKDNLKKGDKKGKK